MNKSKRAISLALTLGFIPFVFGCSTSNKVIERDPCEAEASEVLLKAKALSEGSKETLRGIRYHTKRKVVLMPVTSASGSASSPYGVPIPGAGADLSGFATEIMNQSFRNEGIKTVAWFKVSKKLKELLASQNNNNQQQQMMMNMYGQQGSVVNDENLNEVIQVAKDFSACYVVRPVILKSSNTSNTKTSYNPVGLALGFGGLASSTKTTSNAEIDLKIDIISTREEDIIASKTFSGRSAQVSKKRANTLDGITGSNIFSGGSSTDQLRIAFYDTIDKIVEFLEDKML